MTNLIKECDYCHQEYEGTKTSRYCKRDHFIACEVCGTQILIREMKRPQRSCSPECAKILNKPKPIQKICELCHKEFTATRKTERFCKDDHTTNCVICNTVIVFSPYNPIPKTCSKKCAAKIVDLDERNKKSKETTLLRYGVENVSQSQEVKNKKRETLQTHYGVDNPSFSPEIQRKRDQTFLDRYGVNNAFKVEEFQEKIRQTNIEKYGVDNPFKSAEFQKKAKESIFAKYGVENIFQLPEVQKKAALNSGLRISQVNLQWQKLLKDTFNIDFEFEVPFGSFSADLGYGNLLIDINPTITHSNSMSFVHLTGRCSDGADCKKISHAPHDEKYHQDRALAALTDGKQLLQFFDWYDIDIFLSIVRSKLHRDAHRIGARETVVKTIKQSEANRFLRVNHLNGASNGQTVCLGLFEKSTDTLVHVQTYGSSRMNKNVQWEAIRSASAMNYHIQGAFSKCDSFFMKHYNPESIVSYVDLSISDGSLETKFDGWRLARTNKPSATWVNLINNDNPAFVKDSTARRVSADRVLGFEPGEKYPVEMDGLKITNDYVLLAEGYVKVYDAGTRTFLWNEQ